MDLDDFELALGLLEVQQELDALGNAAAASGVGPEPRGVRAMCEHLGLDCKQILAFAMLQTEDEDESIRPRAARYLMAGLLYGIGLKKKEEETKTNGA